jgi:hypothetical protein
MRLRWWLIALLAGSASMACARAQQLASRTPEVPPPPTMTVVSPVAGPPPALIETRGTIEVVPARGGCTTPRQVVGSGFDAEVPVDVVFAEGPSIAIPPFGSTQTDSAGTFTLPVPLDALRLCRPGWSYVLSARPVATPASVEVRGPRAELWIDPPGPLVLEPNEGCGGFVSIRGAGFPPGAEVHLAVGEFVATVHVFASIGSARADAEGRIDVARLLPVACGPNFPREQAVFASVNSGSGPFGPEGRWYARYRLTSGRE